MWQARSSWVFGLGPGGDQVDGHLYRPFGGGDRRRYWLYYALAFLMGSRRHIFTTFAIFLLVREHGISVQTTALLYLTNSLINTYAYIPYLPLLYALFVLDNVIFGTSIANSTYLQKIALSEEELTSNLSLQQTLNHVSAIVIPLIGGTIWELFGAQAPFLMGVGIVVISLMLVQFMRIPAPEPAAIP